jgi:predicted metallo-beta-lactamase superfamily hydrolase
VPSLQEIYRIRILGTESLGVRGLSCVVETGNRKTVIDPGIALGYQRNGLLPHPVQVGVGEIVREKIIAELRNATDIVFSHFHGDHVPLTDANPYQLDVKQVEYLSDEVRIWAKGPQGLSQKMENRAKSLVLALDRDLPNAEIQTDGTITFSEAVPHGEAGSPGGKVMMTKISDGESTFVHASDIQLLSGYAISEILNFRPDIVLAGGPPIYLQHFMKGREEDAWNNALQLAYGVDTLILDHHLLRCEEGLSWLQRLSEETGHRVICAADFMDRRRHLLEAWRPRLYREIPVYDGWHERYALGNTSTEGYIDRAREIYNWFDY